MSKYIKFTIIEEKPKTKVIEVTSKIRIYMKLGIIKWYPRWRQYTFFPEDGTIFNVECLNDIQSYIRGLHWYEMQKS